MTARALKSLSVALAVCGVASAQAQIVVPASARRGLSSHRLAHSNYLIDKGAWKGVHARSTATRAGVDGYYPTDIQAAYGLSGAGGSQAIAIIDPYHLPTSLNDFNVFSRQFGLPTESSANATASTNRTFQVVYASGAKPSTNGDWGAEIALDVEWAHAVAPNAKIYLIECASENIDDLFTGIRKASTLADVREVSMSFGTSEDSSDIDLDSTFTAPNVVYFAAAGDTSNELDYPAASPNVIGCGGTSLTVTGGAFVSETAWTDGGGGPSTIEPLPAYQVGFTTATRGTPDVAANGDPQTGCAVYDSTPIPGAGTGWFVYGGTSLSTPICAGITNARGSFAASSFAELTRQYGFAGTSHFRDIVSGTSGVYSAHAGYDFVTGLGSLTYLFPTASFAPNAFSVTNGTPVGGIVGNVLVKDNHAYVLRSVAVSAVQQAVVVQGTFATTLNSGASRLGATLSLTGTSAATSNTLLLYNFTTARYDSVSTLALGNASGTASASIANYADYFDPSGNLRFLIVASNSGGSSAAFRLGIDAIQLSVSTTN